MEIFPERLRRLWSKNELRISILISLFLQIYLIVMGSRRKCSRAALLSSTLWLAYLLADGIAIFALGVLSNMQGDSDVKNKNKTDPNNALMGFWAPFLLLHLGGPNSITVYSLEDNELWRRHLLSLVSQVIVAAYAFIRSLSNGAFLAPACLMFIAGIINYGERTWALCYASREHFRDAMLAQPNLSRNYVQLLEKNDAYMHAGLPTKIDIEQVDSETELPLDTTEEDINDEKILEEAYYFFHTFKRLIVDLMLTSNERRKSQAFFLKRKALTPSR